MAAHRGARVVLASRSDETLEQICDEIGPNATYVRADVGHEEDMRKIAEQARLHFGSFDTWVNNAGVSIYGKLLEVPIEDQRQAVRDELLGCRLRVAE